MFRLSHSTTACIVLSLGACLCSTPVQAHARLIGAQPAPSTTVPAPKVIRLEFSEELAKAFSTFKLNRAGAVALKIVASQDKKALVAVPSIALGPGLYTVSWVAVSSDDGHKTSGHFNFTVK